MSIRPGIRRLFRLAHNRAADAHREVDDEIGLHIELRAAQLIDAGMDATAARTQAEIMFARSDGSVRALYNIAEERNGMMRTRERVESWAQDIRYATRGLVHDRGLAAFVIITLALGIGANVTSFSLVDRLLLRGPAHVSHPGELARIYLHVNDPPTGDRTTAWMPYSVYTGLRDNMKSFREMGAYGVREKIVGHGNDARRMRVAVATGSFLNMLGVQPLRGRLFVRDEDASNTSPEAIISEDVWRTRFASDPGVIGKGIMVDDVQHTVIGVTPRDFSGADPQRVDVWTLVNSRNASHINWRPMGRLQRGATIARASAEANTIPRDVGTQSWAAKGALLAASLHAGETATEPLETVMARWLAIVTAMILLITFANVVNLMLVRLTRRRRELAIRVALGSGRGRVIRLLAIEGAILAIAGGIASIAVARVVEPIVSQTLLAGNAGWTFSIDTRLLVLVASFVALTALVVGVLPAMQAGSPQLVNALKASAQDGGANSTMRNTLTVMQAALSVVLLIGASLFLRSMQNVRAVDLGVEPEKVTVASAELPPLKDFSKEGFRAYGENEVRAYRRIVDAVRRMPGVEHAAVTVGLPLDGGSFSANVFVAGYDSVPSLPGGGPFASVVGTDYFRTMGTRIIRGRAFNDSDHEGTAPVMIIGEEMAKTLWPNRDPLGACVRLISPTAACATVVGVAADVHRVGLKDRASMQFYLAFGQPAPFSGASLVLRTKPGATIAWPALRSTIFEAEPSASFVQIARLDESLASTIRPFRLGEVTFGLSGVLALIVAALGLYSLMAYTVAWRTREIGVRLALGASNTGITRLVVGDGTRLAALGIAIGIIITIIGGRWIEPQLFHVTATDPAALAGVTVVLLSVACLAGWIPARRAMRISPTEALRAE